MKIIGIDTGVNTGFAIWKPKLKKFSRVTTLKIHQAIYDVRCLNISDDLFLRIEDARLYKHIGRTKPAIIQQVGSVKRDAKIWEEFLTDLQIPFELVSPIETRKMKSKEFERITNWNGRTSEHARDAAMLVHGLSLNWVKRMMLNQK